jgi:hypothetical protein
MRYKHNLLKIASIFAIFGIISPKSAVFRVKNGLFGRFGTDSARFLTGFVDFGRFLKGPDIPANTLLLKIGGNFD